MPQMTGLFIIKTSVYKEALTRNRMGPFEYLSLQFSQINYNYQLPGGDKE